MRLGLALPLVALLLLSPHRLSATFTASIISRENSSTPYSQNHLEDRHPTRTTLLLDPGTAEKARHGRNYSAPEHEAAVYSDSVINEVGFSRPRVGNLKAEPRFKTKKLVIGYLTAIKGELKDKKGLTVSGAITMALDEVSLI